MKWIWLGARLFLGLVFAYAGFMKLMEPAANFQAVLGQHAFLPAATIPLLARLLPWMEWLGGMFLIAGYQTRAVASALALLSLGFIAMLTGTLLAPGSSGDCGCFGETGLRLSTRQAYLLDWVCLAAACALASREDHPKGV